MDLDDLPLYADVTRVGSLSDLVVLRGLTPPGLRGLTLLSTTSGGEIPSGFCRDLRSGLVVGKGGRSGIVKGSETPLGTTG